MARDHKVIPPIRKRMGSDRRKMDRARRLYARLCYTRACTIPLAERDDWMDTIAARALSLGLWASAPTPQAAMRSVRQSIISKWAAIAGMGDYWAKMKYRHDNKWIFPEARTDLSEKKQSA